jgi:hypothetical protein
MDLQRIRCEEGTRLKWLWMGFIDELLSWNIGFWNSRVLIFDQMSDLLFKEDPKVIWSDHTQKMFNSGWCKIHYRVIDAFVQNFNKQYIHQKFCHAIACSLSTETTVCWLCCCCEFGSFITMSSFHNWIFWRENCHIIDRILGKGVGLKPEAPYTTLATTTR